MPNHVKTRIYAPKEVLEDILKNYTSKYDSWEEYVDFNKIIPTPKYIFQGDLSMEDEKKYGPENCWYQWNIKNWWTKWNSYELYYEDDCFIEFQTAWDTPLPIIRELAMIYEWTELLIKYADEDLWRNCWMFFIKGRDIEEKQPFTNDEVFATMIWYNCDEKEAEKLIENHFETD